MLGFAPNEVFGVLEAANDLKHVDRAFRYRENLNFMGLGFIAHHVVVTFLPGCGDTFLKFHSRFKQS